MIKNIFYGESGYSTGGGDIVLDMPIVPKGDTIEADTPDMTLSGNSKKIDLIYYNSINRLGEVLRSLVYISDVKDKDDTTEISYDPNKLLNNTILEKSLILSDSSLYTWLNDSITQTNITMVNNMSFKIVNSFNNYSLTNDYSPKIFDNTYMFDGWYTLVSMAPNTINDVSSVRAGILRNKSGVIQYATKDNPTLLTDWEDITTIDTSIPIFSMEDVPNVYKHFFVISKTNSLYNKLIEQQLAGEKFVEIRTVRSKLRTIYANANYSAFEIPQHMINAVNLSLLSLIT